MNIVFMASEVAPFAKTGGLGDVVGALPKALKKLGQNSFIIMPKYKQIDNAKFGIVDTGQKISVYIGDKLVEANIFTALLDGGIPVYFIDNVHYFGRDGLYETNGLDYMDNVERFTFFSKVSLKLLKKFEIKPDIIHCNDWQTGLIPVYLKTIYRCDAFFDKTQSVFTIHNIAFQGAFDIGSFNVLGLTWDVFNQDGLEFYGKINFLKGGLVFADIITTVSLTYSKEIQTAEFGCGLYGILRKRNDALFGIVNGIDEDEWNPVTDKHIIKQYSINNLSGKVECKKDIMNIYGLEYEEDVPLVGIISRLDEQKGFDLIEEVIEDLMSMNIRLCLLGLGKPKYHTFFTDTAAKYNRQIGVRFAFDNTIAHKIEAGSDIFFMPSKYEPCGMNQLYSLKYGSIPVVRNTGGLADTIHQYDAKTMTGNGFKFFSYSSVDFLSCAQGAINLYKNNEKWKNLVKAAMSTDYSWQRSAKEYLTLYNRLKEI